MAPATKFITRTAVIALASICLLQLVRAEAILQPKPLQIGIAKTFLIDQPKSVVEVAGDDFKDVLKKTTALDGELVTKFTGPEVAEKLDAKQLDFGIFHAHEYAWLQKKYPQFQPLLIAANKHPIERVFLIVHQKDPAKSLADLKGKKLDMPTGTNEPCRVYLERLCDDKGPAAYFGKIEKSKTAREALDNVARGTVDVAILSTSSLEHYKDVRGPVFAKNLRVLQQSEEFPPSLIVHKKGALDEAIVKQMRDGLLKAHNIEEGREMMKSWNIESFAILPKDYEKKLIDVLKAFPPR